MKQREIRSLIDADRDARRIDEWWLANRGNSNLFVEELAEAFQQLCLSPGIGTPFPNRWIPDLRRYLLRTARYHVYYVYSDTRVVVVSVWGAVRKKPPGFARRAVSVRRVLDAEQADDSPPDE